MTLKEMKSRPIKDGFIELTTSEMDDYVKLLQPEELVKKEVNSTLCFMCNSHPIRLKSENSLTQ